MFDQKILSATGASLANIDVSAEIAAATTLAVERGKIVEAIENGRARMFEIAREIARVRDGAVVDPIEAAEALIAGVDVQARSIDDLEAEKKAIEIGLRELRQREDAVTMGEAEHRGAAVSIIAGTASELVVSLEKAATDAVEKLSAIYASVEAVRQATASGNATELARRLEASLGRLIANGLGHQGTVSVPPDIVKALAPGAEAMRQARLSCPVQVRGPQF
ncbi:MAG: hypothetical protein COC10_09670 [Sphingobium sp.]|nr:MAG: hypothetical protein COC10_09670 [Sphingobium sp.]